jgi:hypothetical protein
METLSVIFFIGNSYKNPNYEDGSNEPKSFLASSHNFQTVKIEVKTKQINDNFNLALSIFSKV